MEKREVLILELVLAFVVLSSFVSAVYICSDGSQITRDSREIGEFTKKTIDDLGIAVIEAEETPAINRIAAEIFVEAEKVSLSNETPSENIELAGTEYEVKLINATENMAKISIDGSSQEINEKEVTSLKGLRVVVVEADIQPVDQISAEVIVGVKKLDLSNSGNLSEIVTINGKNYSIELVTASDTSAEIGVSKCETGNIIKEQEQINNTVNVTGNVTNINQTEGNGSSQNITNVTSQNLTNATSNVTSNINEDKEKSSLFKSVWFWILVIVIVVIIVLFVIYKINRSSYPPVQKT